MVNQKSWWLFFKDNNNILFIINDKRQKKKRKFFWLYKQMMKEKKIRRDQIEITWSLLERNRSLSCRPSDSLSPFSQYIIQELFLLPESGERLIIKKNHYEYKRFRCRGRVVYRKEEKRERGESEKRLYFL